MISLKLNKIFSLFIIVSALFISFYNLGGTSLFSDEGDTAMIARNISYKNHFLPKTWDGKTLLSADIDGRDFNKINTPLLHTWGQYYTAKIGHILLGETSTFGTRFPFAFFGFLSLGVIYLLLLKTADKAKINKKNALILIAATVFSFSYFGFIRVARYYSITLFISTLILFLLYTQITNEKKMTFSQMLILFFLEFGLYYFHYLSFGLFTISIWLFLLFQKDWQNLMLFSITNAILAIFVLVDFYIFHLDIILLFKFTGKTLIKHYIQTGFNIFRFMPLIILLPFTLLKDRNNPWGRLFIVSCITIVLVYTTLQHGHGNAKHFMFLLPLGVTYLLSSKKILPKYLFAWLILFFVVITNIDTASNLAEGVAVRSLFKQNYYYNDIIHKLNSLPAGTIKNETCGGLLHIAFYTPKHQFIGQLDKNKIPSKSFYHNFPEFCYMDYPSDYILSNNHSKPTQYFYGEKYKLIFFREYKPKTLIWGIKRFINKGSIKQAIYQKI